MCSLFTVSFGLGSIVTAPMNWIGTNVSYVWDLERNLVALEKAREDLIQKKEDLDRRIRLAEPEQKTPLNLVLLWLTRVRAAESEAGELLKDDKRSQETEKLCLGGFCSKSPESTHQFGKQVAELLKEVEDLRAKTFEEVAERKPRDTVDEMPIEPTVGLESKLDQVWGYIHDGQLKIIGLYGKGGVGKTTLLTQINNKFYQLGDEFVVIWVPASKDLQPEKIQLEKIQEVIWKKIGMLNEEWKRKPTLEKARDIYKILKRRKFVLLLDGIWERVNLIEIGIPHQNENIDFKVIFTTRSSEVCSQMLADTEVKLECLSHAESSLLFKEIVGRETLESHEDITLLAENVVRKCGGLPLALVAIGRAMAGLKHLEEWEYAKSILEKSAHKFSGMKDDVFYLLKFSYDNLRSDIYRSCLLYCSLFPQDYSIAKRDLIDCWIGEGFLENNDGISERNFGYRIIGSLLRACLLEEGEEGENGETVKMHDVNRVMALWIACEVEQEKFLVRSSVGLTGAPDVREWENVKRMSLIDNEIENLSETPNCPELQTLFLQGNSLLMITSGFFKHMLHLQVLNLSANRYLTKLPAGISALVELQYLNLSRTDISELPEELKALTNLICLNLEHTYKLYKIPGHLISSLSMLQVLRMFRCQYLEFTSEDEGELFIKELASLKHLNVLSINFKTSHALQRILSSHELQHCQTESLYLHLTDGSISLTLRVLRYLHTLNIWSQDLEELVIDHGMSNISQFLSLQRVELCRCWKLRDATWLIYAPNLKNLRIWVCSEMKEIISVGGKIPEMMGNLTPFARLQVLVLAYLPQLKAIYCKPLPFPHLKNIDITRCPNLKKLPLDSNSTISRELQIKGEQDWWNKLQWDQATHDRFLHFFKAEH